MKISVIVPQVNREEMFRWCLKGLQAQNFPKDEFEVIVVGSLPESLATDNDCNFNVVPYSHRPGEKFPASHLRNLGAAAARGELLIFLDCDIILPEYYLKFAWDKIGSTDALMFSLRKKIPRTATYKELSDLKRIKCLKDERADACNILGCEFSELKSICFWVYSHTLCIRREIFEKTGGFSEDFIGWGYEDLEFAYRLYRADIPIICDNKSECYHIWHNEVIDDQRQQQVEENLQIFRDKHPDRMLDALSAYEMNFSAYMKIGLSFTAPEAYLLSMIEVFVRGYIAREEMISES